MKIQKLCFGFILGIFLPVLTLGYQSVTSAMLEIDDSGFNPASLWIDNFGYEAGSWRVENHPRMMADVNGDGKQDVVGFGSDGVRVALSTGTSFSKDQLWIDNFGYEAGSWRVENHPRMMADANGDGKQDVVGFGSDGVRVALSTGTSFSKDQLWIDNFGYEAGSWRVENHPRMMADANGDHSFDIIGFGNDGVRVSTSKDVIFSLFMPLVSKL